MANHIHNVLVKANAYLWIVNGIHIRMFQHNSDSTPDQTADVHELNALFHVGWFMHSWYELSRVRVLDKFICVVCESLMVVCIDPFNSNNCPVHK